MAKIVVTANQAEVLRNICLERRTAFVRAANLLGDRVSPAGSDLSADESLTFDALVAAAHLATAVADAFDAVDAAPAAVTVIAPATVASWIARHKIAAIDDADMEARGFDAADITAAKTRREMRLAELASIARSLGA